MIDITREPLLTFGEASKFLPTTGRPSYATFWRWFRKGIKGVQLETVLVGGRRYTTAKAMQAFVAALSSPPQIESTSRPTGGNHSRVREAERQLAEFGIL